MLLLKEAIPGSDDPVLRQDALKALEETSRTFYIPISRLPPRLQEAVGAAYLCLRAIDEIEDHPSLAGGVKSHLLRNISRTIQASGGRVRVEDLLIVLPEFADQLAPVTKRLSDWMSLAPACGPGLTARRATAGKRSGSGAVCRRSTSCATGRRTCNEVWIFTLPAGTKARCLPMPDTT
jgi:hypothetical protein